MSTYDTIFFWSFSRERTVFFWVFSRNYMRAYRILLGILTNKKRPLRSSREPERLFSSFLFSTSTHKSTVVTNRTLRSFLFVTLVTKSICLRLECFGKINSPGIYLLQNNRARHFYISFLLVTSVASSFDLSTRPVF